MYQINCSRCGKEYDNQWWLCPACNGSLVATYQPGLKNPQFPLKELPANSLGEGSTPLVPLPGLSQALGIELWGKCEFGNPTGSFKDRGSIIETCKAIELGKTGVVCASTGNMAASLAAYSARSGLRCKVVVPTSTPRSKLRQATICGAQLVPVAGTYDDCVAQAQQLAAEEGLFLCGDYVLRREGQKTIGWELANRNFDGFVVPVGNGTLGIAIAQGLAEAGDSRAAFIGAQPATVNPIEQAWKRNEKIQPISGTQTIASACNVGDPLDGTLTLEWVNKTKGSLIAVSDIQITRAQNILATTEGIFVETAGAAGLAGIIKNSKQYVGKKLVIILTGSGLKEASAMPSIRDKE